MREERLKLFTQCSKCETVFELSAETLRAAGGQVRCGHCGEIFNALARLAEDDSAFHSGESHYDLESRADAILENSGADPAPPEDDAEDEQHQEDEELDPGVEIAELHVLDESDDSGQSDDVDDESPGEDGAADDDPAIFEFTLPPGELDRIFVESKGVPFIALPPGLRPPRVLAEPREGSGGLGNRPLAPVTQLPRAEAGARTSVSPPILTAATPASAALRTAAAMRASVSGLTVPDDVRLQMLAGAATRRSKEPLELPELPPESSWRWWAGAAALALLLALQMIHENRQSLAGAGVFGPAVRAVYSKLGSDVALPVDLNAYQLRQWGVSAVPESNTTLRVRASIMNISSQLKPYPLLRISLANRFGNKIGSRNFEPAEYTGKPVVRLLSPGERIDAVVDILDPTQEAEGFEINVCLRATDKRVACVGDAATPRTP